MKTTALIVALSATLCASAACGRKLMTEQTAKPAASAANITYGTVLTTESIETTSAAITTTKQKASAETVKTEKLSDTSYQTSASKVKAAANTAPAEKAAVNTTAAKPAEVRITTAKAETPAPASTSANGENTDAASGTAFRQGTVGGNVYTSEYAGFRFTAPEGTQFLDRDGLFTDYMMPCRFKTPEEKKYYLTGIYDASVTYDNAEGSVRVWFYNTKLRYPDAPNMSAEGFVQSYFEENTDGGITDICGPEAVTLGGQEYLRVTRKCFSVPSAVYVRRIDSDFIVMIEACGTAADDFEARFTAIG